MGEAGGAAAPVIRNPGDISPPRQQVSGVGQLFSFAGGLFFFASRLWRGGVQPASDASDEAIQLGEHQVLEEPDDAIIVYVSVREKRRGQDRVAAAKFHGHSCSLKAGSLSHPDA